MTGFFGRLFSRQKQHKLRNDSRLLALPESFVIFDFETTGLDADRHEIIEIGAIRANKNSHNYDTFQTFIKNKKKLSKTIVNLTGITDDQLARSGDSPLQALTDFRNFVGVLPMIAYNLQFDKQFLDRSCEREGLSRFENEMGCALVLARSAWPQRKSYRLTDLASDGGLSTQDSHRALGDCQRTLIVYSAAASKLGRWR